MPQQYHPPVVLEPAWEEPSRYNVRVSALPGRFTYGESIEDALVNDREAITGYVESLVADGEPIPAESHPSSSLQMLQRSRQVIWSRISASALGFRRGSSPNIPFADNCNYANLAIRKRMR